MDTSRRNALKVMAASGLTIALPAVARSATERPPSDQFPPLPLYVVADPTVQPSSFGQAANMAQRGSSVRRSLTHISSGLGMDYVNEFNALLEGARPVRIIGLVDDANAAILVSLARAANARMHWLAQHRSSGRDARHTILAATGDPCCERLAVLLSAKQQLPQLADKWVAQLGYSLAGRLAVPARHQVLARLGAKPQAGSFVSFSLDTNGALHG